MKFAFALEYSTEGAPLLIADSRSAVHWRGQEDDGSGVIVDYAGANVFELPPELIQSKRTHRQTKRFPTLQEAEAFQARVLAAFQQLHPTAARFAGYEDSPFYYIDTKRIFGAELKRSTLLGTACRRMESEVQVLVFDRKQKAHGVFVHQDGGGPGVIAADVEDGVLVVAHFHYGADRDVATVAAALADTKPPRAKAKISLAGPVFIFDAAESEADIAQLNWQRSSLSDALELGLAVAPGGPLRVSNQQAPGGAFAHLPAGEYELAHDHDHDVAGGASVVWLSRAR